MFLVRLSAPAWKWHDAQAVRPSPPTCMSQKRALPSTIAALRLETKSSRFGGRGTGTDSNAPSNGTSGSAGSGS